MNRVKTKEVPKQTKKKSAFRKGLNWLMNGEFLVKGGVTQMPFILFLTGLFLFHIWWVYFSENTIRDISEKTRELHEVKSEYNTIISNEESKTQLSNVLRSSEAIKLKKPSQSPEILEN
ncbi:MAG: FtsL-like putative cell division protein [Flavobacteriales bacterium]